MTGVLHLEGLVLQFSSSALGGQFVHAIQQGLSVRSAFILRTVQLLGQLCYAAASHDTTRTSIWHHEPQLAVTFQLHMHNSTAHDESLGNNPYRAIS